MKQVIVRSRKNCMACQRPFQPGETYLSTLLAGGEQWERMDLCQACHQTREKEASAAGRESLATWKVQVPEKQSKGLEISEDAIWQILGRARQDETIRVKPFTYILCLMMVRRRKLRVSASRRHKASELQTYRNISRGFELEVVVPHLSPLIMNRLQKEMAEFLSQEK